MMCGDASHAFAVRQQGSSSLQRIRESMAPIAYRRGIVPMKPEDAIPLLKAIIDRERKDGCTMAHESLIEPALRRWKTYDDASNKDKSLKHRAHDLEKGLIQSFTDYGYDTCCIRHLAQSFAEVLMQESVVELVPSPHRRSG